MRSDTTFARVHDETSSELNKLRYEWDIAVARHHELLASSHCVVKAHEARINTAADSIVEPSKIYDEGLKVTMKTNVVE